MGDAEVAPKDPTLLAVAKYHVENCTMSGDEFVMLCLIARQGRTVEDYKRYWIEAGGAADWPEGGQSDG